MKDFYWLNDKSRTFLSRGYIKEEMSAEERIRQIGDYAENILSQPGFSDKFYGYMARGFYSLSSPVWSNFGAGRALPISCNGCFVNDTIHDILWKAAETGTLTKNGAGTSGYFGKLRPRGANISAGGTSSGPVHFMQIFDSVTDVISQSSVRRGSFAAYLDIDHPDIEEFLKIKSEGDPIQNLSIGVCVSDAWMQSMVDGDKEKRKTWGKVIKKRFESGYPYIFFSDTANNAAPQAYKDKGKIIHAANLCAETAISSDVDETFVCDLSSINLVHWDEIKETDAVETLLLFLDAVMSDYISKTADDPFLAHAHNFAVRQRALGLGVLGWHTLLQSRMIPFESMEAKILNTQIFKEIKERCDKENRRMAEVYGEPELLKGYGLRNITTMAIAPTVSSSFILGQVSQGIEPIDSNYFVKNTAKMKATFKNPYLKKLLKEKELDTDDVWASILAHGGSVQHLDTFTDHEKDVFKTFSEISQKEIVIQAAARQRYIDQGQSLNLKIPPDASPKEVSQLLIFGWENKIKSFYYQRSSNPSQKLMRSILTCQSCEG